MLAGPLVEAGHETFVETIPVDFERIVRFGPQVIVLGIRRQDRARGRAIEDPERDILGYRAMLEVENYPAFSTIPILILGSGLDEHEIPTRIRYDLFLSLPRDSDLYVPRVEELSRRVKTRRRISGYICPNCGSRLTYSLTPAKDFFCPRCHTVVALIEGEGALVRYPNEKQELLPVERLLPPNMETPAETPPETPRER